MKNTFQTGRDYVNLASESATNHIIFGEGLNSNLGGHLWPGALRKTPFPSTWSADKILDVVSDIATDPQVIWKPSTKMADTNRMIGHAIRENIEIRVIIEGSENIISSYPIR